MSNIIFVKLLKIKFFAKDNCSYFIFIGYFVDILLDEIVVNKVIFYDFVFKRKVRREVKFKFEVIKNR